MKDSWNDFWGTVIAAWRQLPVRRPKMRRTPSRCATTALPGIESLEDRSLLSPFYDLSVVASTGSGFVGFGDLASINNAGTIAFVGYRNDVDADGGSGPDDSRESGLWTAAPGQAPVNINPDFSDTNDRDFGRAVAINDEGILTARDRYNGLFFLREWDASSTDSFTDIASSAPGLLTFGKYSAVQTFSDINNAGDVAFVGQTLGGEFRTIELHGHNQPDGEFTRLDTFPSGAVGGPTPRLQLTDDGRVLARLSNDAIVLFDSNGHPTNFVTKSDGFTVTGAAPGITNDGRVVVFTGDRGHGPGIFASYYSDGARHIVRVAGEGYDGWTDFDLNSAVRVAGSIADAFDSKPGDRGVTVAFEGTNSGVGHGIFTARVSFFGLSPSLYDSDSIYDVRVSGAAPVALVGDSLTPGGPAITELEPYGMNDQGRGELAFWAKTGSHESIVRALPQQVVFVDLSPGIYGFGGYTAANLGLLEEVGMQSGWDGTFVDAMNHLGYTGNAFSLGVQIRQQVQDLYNATGARVRVVSTPPVQVKRTATDQAGNVLTINGVPIQNGTFQTIQVGESDSGRGLLGLSSPIYSRAGELDFYNQIQDDTALVFVNHIFNSGAFTVPFAQLTDAQRIQAVADVIAHESAHNFGLVHTRRDYEDDLMHYGTVSGEFSSAQDFSQEPTAVDPTLHSPGATENPAARLVYSTGGAYQRAGDAPSPQILSNNGKFTVLQRYKFSGSMTSGDTSVSRLLVGTINGLGLDLLPEFQDVGTGSLTTLLGGTGFSAAEEGSVLLIGSTDGTAPDIVGVPQSQAGAQNTLSLTIAGLVSDERLRGGFGQPFNLYHIPASGDAELIGTFTVEGEPAATVYAGSSELSTGSILGLGETTPNGGPLTKVLTVRNSGAGPLTLGTVSIAGSGYSITQPAQTTLAPGEETTVTVTLTDSTAGIGIPGTVTIPNNSANAPFTLTVRGTVDTTPRISGVTRLDNGTGPVQIAIDFSGLLKTGPASDADNFTISRPNGETVPIVSAVYSQVGQQSRVVLTTSVNANDLPSGDYQIRIDGTKVVTTSGAPLATTRENLLSHQVWETIDIVTIGSNGSGSAAVLSGPEATGLTPPKFIVQDDFNGDGIQDFVATGDTTGQLAFHFGVAEGGYETVLYPLPGPTTDLKASPQSILATDWNADGYTDLIVFDSVNDYFQGTFNRLFVLINDGSGHFSNAIDTPIPVESDAVGTPLGVADFTGDGQLDIAIAGRLLNVNSPHVPTTAMIAIYGKDPFLGYSKVDEFSVGHDEWIPSSGITTDLNGDGRTDLVVETGGFFGATPMPVVFLNTPTGLIPGADLSYNGETGAFAVADFNSDGKLDIAIVNDNYSNNSGVHEGGVVSLLLGNGAGQFVAQPNIILNRRGVSFAAAGDVNQDGKPDLILRADPFEQGSYDTTAELSIWTLLGDGFGDFDLSSPLVPVAPTGNVVPGNFILRDMTGDGYPELSFGNQATGRIGLFINDGAGHLSASLAGPLTSTATAFRDQIEQESGIIIADLNRDGFPDQLRVVSDVGIFSSQAIDVLWGTASGQFEIVSSVNIDSYSRSSHDQSVGDVGFLRAGDINNDGWLDLIVGADNGYGGPLAIYLGVDGKNFAYAPELLVDAGDALGVVTGNLADLNGDGNLDFVAVISSNGGGPTGFGVFFGNGTGKLTYNSNAFQTVPGMATQLPVIADFNGDNKVDVAMGSYASEGSGSTSSILIYLGLGNGKFSLGQTVPRPSADYEPQLFLNDINGDGKPDLLSPNEVDRTLDFYLATNAGQFAAAPELSIPIPYSAAHLVVGDLTGDGFDDIAMSQDTTTISDFVSTVPVFAGDGTGHFSEAQLVETGALWPFSLTLVPIAGAIDAGTFTITRPVLSVPAGALNISTATNFEQSVAINPRPLLANYSDDPIAVAVSVAPLHGTVTVQNNGTPNDLGDDTFSYLPAPGFSGVDQFTFVAADGRGGTATGVVSITARAANKNPIVTVTPGALNYFDMYQSRTIDAGATVTDADSTNFQGAKLKIEITSGFNADYDYLELDTGGFGPGELYWDFDGSLSYSGALIGKVTGGYHEPMVISFSSPTVTSAIVQDVLRHVQFSNADSDRSVSSQRTVTFLVTDGDGGSGTATKTILLPAEGSNLLPVVTTSTGDQFYTVGSPAIVIDNGATVADADTPILDGGSLTIDCANFTIFDDRLAIQTQGTGTGQINLSGTSVRYGSISFGTYSGGFVDSSPLVITFNSNATPAIVQELVRQITFSNVDAFNPYMEPRNIRFVVNDGVGGVSVPAIRTITFVVGNAAPEITLSSGTTSFTAGQSPVTIDTGIFVDDSDSDDFGGGTLTVDFQSGQSAADRLSIRNVGTGLGQINLAGNTVNFGSIPLGTYSGGFTSNSPLVISLNTNASPARIELLMRQLTFQVDAVTPTTSDRVIRFVISDGDGGSSSPVTKTVLVNSAAGNQAPTIQLPGSSPTYSKLGPAVAIDSLAVVQGPSTGTGTVGGGVLTISINDVNTGKKKLDVFNLSALNVVGTSRGTQLINGRLVTVYDLDENVSASVLQNALRGVKFQTSKKGLKYTTRTVQIQLADSEGDTSAVVTKSINVSKKRIKAS